MAAKKHAPAKRPGKSIEEWQRHTVQVKLRLPPDVAKTLHDRAREAGMRVSAFVARLLGA